MNYHDSAMIGNACIYPSAPHIPDDMRIDLIMKRQPDPIEKARYDRHYGSLDVFSLEKLYHAELRRRK